ncbi:acyl-CoA dehydrogenase family protein [Caenimonas sp. SL110]|uniref:acyl-CoA dehydrogenase family protein n=1 Tax=Caenimonas sp. SL110 TaxID=1450524 RepID=UPI000653B193|nr:acyl-CoA dehydrogenase family protein [Caenimonas sp. SL110]
MPQMLEEARERLELIRDSAASVVPRDAGAARARALRFSQPGFDRAQWKQMCGLGWGGLRVPEAQGGSGFDVTALCAVAQQLGASLSPEPFIAVAGAAQLLRGSTQTQVMAGDEIVVPAWNERAHDLDTAGRTQFRGGKVSGTKRLVSAGHAADAFLVSTNQGLALVRKDAPGVTVSTVKLHDGGFTADVVFAEAPGEAIAGSLDSVFEECALANAAYLLGTMEAAFDITLAYMQVRKQFGKPIGSFQALQHRAVDLKIQIELTRAVINDAAAQFDDDSTSLADRQTLVSRAKMRAGDAGMLVAKEAVQFHGAMGMTDECDIGLYARKILAVHNDWGSVAAHRQRFTATLVARHD